MQDNANYYYNSDPVCCMVRISLEKVVSDLADHSDDGMECQRERPEKLKARRPKEVLTRGRFGRCRVRV